MIATFAVDEVVEGTQTGRVAQTLVVAPSQLAVGAGNENEPALAEATVEVVRPGDPVRIANVCDAVIPDVKVARPDATFPGVLGPRVPAGRGITHRLTGVAVLAICDWRGLGVPGAEELPDAFVDMAGPGADRSPWGATANIVVRGVPTAGVDPREADTALRRAALRVARDLAATTIGEEPSETLRIAPLGLAQTELPSVVAVVQLAAEGPLVDTFWYGEPVDRMLPLIVEPAEVLDGALTNGAYDWASVRNPTATYQRCALIRELVARHGTTLRFGGVVLSQGYLDGADQKRAAADRTAALVRDLGADVAICTTFSSGNSHTDTMLTVRALERDGIAACALVGETNGGLTDHVPEADCLVSTGNEDELVDAWIPERTVGSEDAARSGEPVPTWAYLGATNQLGDARWTAVPA